ncbi:MAG: glycosyltransferase family 2 protein, partial [Betaproteobacteria bacterium]|nr:glycosyltransferase family 2 protein [Betaproteobacteria bacterium]
MNARNDPGQQAPTVSVLFLAFNQGPYVEQAARSILEQRGIAPLEIVLSDDASTDATFDILRALADQYRGPHQVRV